MSVDVVAVLRADHHDLVPHRDFLLVAQVVLESRENLLTAVLVFEYSTDCVVVY